MPTTTKTSRRTRMNIWVDDDIVADLRAAATDQRCTMATLIRMRLRGLNAISMRDAA